MWFRLALALGRPVAELQATLSAAEWAEWKAFWRIEPWGDVRADWHNAILAYYIYAAHAGKRGRGVKVDAFLLSEMERAGKASDPASMLEIGRRLAAQYGGEWSENGVPVNPAGAARGDRQRSSQHRG